MFCPKCRSEYTEGVTICADCQASLLDHLPEPQTPSRGRELEFAAFVVIFSTIYKFAVKTSGTIWAAIFINPALVRTTASLTILADLSWVVFFVIFFRNLTNVEQRSLRYASMLVTIGYAAILLKDVKGLLLVFKNVLPIPFLSHLAGLHSIEALVPWLSSVFLLIFFVFFQKDRFFRSKMSLKKSAYWAAYGAIGGAVLNSVAVVTFYARAELNLTPASLKPMMYLLLPVYLFSVITLLNFMITFYKDLRADLKQKADV